MQSITQATELIERTLYDLLTPEYTSVPQVAPQICEMLPLDPALMYGERIDSVTDFGEPSQVPFGQRLPERSFVSGYKVWSKMRKIGHEVTLDRELLVAEAANGRLQGRIEGLFRGQGVRFANYTEKWAAGYLEAGVLTAGSDAYFNQTFPGESPTYTLFNYDGQPLFDTAHVLKIGSATPSNHTASAPLSATTLEAGLLLAESTSAVDERGAPIDNTMDAIMVPKALESTANQIVNTVGGYPGSANHGVNPLGGGRLRVIVNRYLTDADSWYLLRLNSGRRMLRMRDSGEPRVEIVEDPLNHQVVIQAYKYFSLTAQDWRGGFAHNIAAA